jgi:sec-independent protein translocase protein TatA
MFEGAMQPMHWLIVIAVGLLLFGPSKLADLGKGLGQGIRQFKDGLKEANDEVNKPSSEEVKK